MTETVVRNVNVALPLGIQSFVEADKSFIRDLYVRGKRRIEWTKPWMTTYTRPTERVLLHPLRDANPFFHLMESLWVLAGREDVDWLAQWLPKIADYSDDGQIFHGAYGARMLNYRQVENVLKLFQEDRNTTRAVIALYDPNLDTQYRGKDLPCNDTLFLSIRDDALNLTVCNRSNDLIWGAYGANVVQFSMIQEYIAMQAGVHVGIYQQFSNNTHIYPDESSTQKCLTMATYPIIDRYDTGEVKPYPLFTEGVHPNSWEADLHYFMHKAPRRYTHLFFDHVAVPMAHAHAAYRAQDYKRAIALCSELIGASDWRTACVEWLERRASKAAVET